MQTDLLPRLVAPHGVQLALTMPDGHQAVPASPPSLTLCHC